MRRHLLARQPRGHLPVGLPRFNCPLFVHDDYHVHSMLLTHDQAYEVMTLSPPLDTSISTESRTPRTRDARSHLSQNQTPRPGAGIAGRLLGGGPRITDHRAAHCRIVVGQHIQEQVDETAVVDVDHDGDLGRVREGDARRELDVVRVPAHGP